MNDPTLTCQDEQRHRKVRAEGFNGLDYLEVYDDHGQPTLVVYFLNKLGEARERITEENVLVKGGRRITDIKVLDIDLCIQEDPERDDCMQVWLDKYGDFSTYTLCLVEVDEHKRPILEGESNGRQKYRPLDGFDPRYACLEFSFKAGCPSDLDCKPQIICPPEERAEPEINYLAKDYASFRQLILDRLALIMPDWQERHVPDLGIALVEILAYVGDHLSYYQDAVATEAYLDTARQRISVRRHARLVDYQMHEGCNARAWVCVETDTNLELDPNDVYFITGKGLPVGSTVLTPEDLRNIPLSHYEVFEPLVEKPRSLRFRKQDLKDPGCLAAKLRDARDPVSQYLREQLSKETQALLDKYPGDGSFPPSDALRKALVGDLDRIIHGKSLADEKGFKQVKLTEETRKRMGQGLQGDDLVRLNRTLLEETYPQEIARSRKPDEPIHLYEAHNKIHFYTWGDQECCLPRGATSATLRDGVGVEISKKEQGVAWVPGGREEETRRPIVQIPVKEPKADWDYQRELHLEPGDVLLFEELIGPNTNDLADADPARRHAVRLTNVEEAVDELYHQPVIEIEWAEEDALPFPLCISAIGPAPECELLGDISVARGNVILVDHGRRIEDEPLGEVPVETTEEQCGDDCHPAETVTVPGKFRPRLQRGPLTFSQPLPADAPASHLLTQDPRQALPQVKLTGIPSAPDRSAALFSLDDLKDREWLERLVARLLQAADPVSQYLLGQFSSETRQLLKEHGDSSDLSESLLRALIEELKRLLQWWTPQRDLLASRDQDLHFVVEMDNDRRAHLRFGDDELGMMPETASDFHATYRIGNGSSGNVGAKTISHIVFRQARPSGVTLQPRNPLPAQGGTAPEPLAEVKLFAPHAFRADLQRAITADDYADLVMRDFKGKVQRAAATLRWTGSWYEVLVAIDPRGQVEADEALLEEIKGYLYRYRRIGHDLVVASARYVPLDIEMIICVLPDYLRGHVKAALFDVFSNRRLPDGRLGFFHPDNLTFGEGIYLSKLVATAQAVPGVENVAVKKLERLDEGSNGEIESSILPLGPLEVARLDNDPSFPEHGQFKLDMRGGR
jgi:predicted phage baseplate assembly protein